VNLGCWLPGSPSWGHNSKRSDGERIGDLHCTSPCPVLLWDTGHDMVTVLVTAVEHEGRQTGGLVGMECQLPEATQELQQNSGAQCSLWSSLVFDLKTKQKP
jgi:hypothetical protein